MDRFSQVGKNWQLPFFSIWGDIREGLQYIRGWPGLVALIGLALIVKVALTPAVSLLPLLVRDHFSGDAARLNLLESVAGVGVLVGGLVLSVWDGFRRKIYTTITGIAALGVGFVVLGLTPASLFWIALVSTFVVGFTIPLIDGPIMAILRCAVAPEVQGRVFTLVGSLLSLTSPVGLAVAGPVSDWIGLRIWYLVAGLIASIGGLGSFFIPALVHVEDNQAGSSCEEVRGPVVHPAPAIVDVGD